jgi:O-antigen/teichoic acid export membrane protein
LLSNILILGLNASTGIIVARLLGPEGRGEMEAMGLWPVVFGSALALGLPSALLYNLKRYPDRGSEVFAAALLLATFLGVSATMAGVLIIPLWLTEYSLEATRLAQLVMLTAPLVLLQAVLTFALQAREEFALYNAFRYTTPLLTLLALGMLALAHHLTPFNAALAYLLPGIPFTIWMLVRLWRTYQPAWRGLTWAFKSLISYGSRSCGVDLVGQLAQQLDRVLVLGLLSPKAMGLYVVAMSLAGMLHVFPSAAVSILFPKASGRNVDEVVSLAGRAARGSIAATALAAIGLALFSPWALTFFYGQEYLAAIPIFRLLLFALVFGGLSWVLSQALMAMNRPEIVTALEGIYVGLSLSLVLALVPLYGLKGAGLAILISSAIRFVLVASSFPLILKARIPRLWPSRTDLAAVITMVSTAFGQEKGGKP